MTDDLNDLVSNFIKINEAEIQMIDANGNVISTSKVRIDHIRRKHADRKSRRALQGINGQRAGRHR